MTTAVARQANEDAIDAAHKKGEFKKATTLVLEAYGAEIGGYLAATLRHEADAADAFSIFSEDVWKGIEKFDFRSTSRTWAYVLARNAAHRLRRSPHHKREVLSPLDDSADHARLLAQVRLSTARFLRTDSKDKIQTLREKLTAGERELLVLRVDRNLEWSEIANIIDDDNDTTREEDTVGTRAALSKEDERKRTATLRKRFERTKDKLRRLAKDAGLLS